MSLRERELAVTLPVYPQLDIEPVSAEGVYITTADGRRIMDLYGGHAVAALGYGHPALVRAVREQVGSMVFQSNAVPLHARTEAARRLVEFAPPNLERAFFVNSGAEANENALRIAFMLSGRTTVVALEHGFHGRTAAAAAATWGSARRWYGFPRTPFDVRFAARDDAAAALAAIDGDVAAVILEPVQGVAGAYDLAADFAAAVAERAAAVGALLIADEVQSGIGRSGYPFAHQRLGIRADIVTCAKALGGGIPCGAVLTSSAIANELRPGDLGTTFGGGPLAARAISAVIDTIEREKLLDNVLAREAQIRASCVTGPVERIQGLGFLLGLCCREPAAGVRDRLLARGYLTGTSADPAVLRLLPPLTLTEEHVRQFAETLRTI